MTELRNTAIAAELDRAVAHRSYVELFLLLRRFSGLPGPRASEKLAWAVAQSIAAFGSKADGLVAALCTAGSGRTLETGTIEFLPMVGAFSLASRYPAENAESVLKSLRPLSEDPRHFVRESVVAALTEMGRSGGEPLVERFAAWMDGYLSASVALAAATARSWLDALRSPDSVVARLDDAFMLIESAPRADQRSQGYRTLLKALPENASRLVDRFPDATIAWLESRAATEHVELREALALVITRVRERGHNPGKLEKLGDLLDASAPPRRDPRTYVGPTRKRGSRRR